MNADIKAAWVTALRSPEYTQGFGRLKTGKPDPLLDETCESNPPGYCCMGVLMDLAVKAGVVSATDTWWHNKPAIPWLVAEWAGLALGDAPNDWCQWVDPDVTFEGSRHNLARLNDRERLSFERIADLIEAETEL